jgi:hypothetical protein
MVAISRVRMREKRRLEREQRKSVVIPGWRIWLTSQSMSRLLPRAFVARTLERLTRPERYMRYNE